MTSANVECIDWGAQITSILGEAEAQGHCVERAKGRRWTSASAEVLSALMALSPMHTVMPGTQQASHMR